MCSFVRHYRRSFLLRRKSFFVWAISASFGRGGKTCKKQIIQWEPVIYGSGKYLQISNEISVNVQGFHWKLFLVLHANEHFPTMLLQPKAQAAVMITHQVSGVTQVTRLTPSCTHSLPRWPVTNAHDATMERTTCQALSLTSFPVKKNSARHPLNISLSIRLHIVHSCSITVRCYHGYSCPGPA